jgi:methanogenic corrinoid protein MtbC1
VANELHTGVAKVIRAKRDALAQDIVTRQYQRKPERWVLYGEPGRDKSQRDAAYHLSYLCESVNASDPTLFREYVAWLKVLFTGLGFPTEVVPETLKCIREVLEETLPAEMAAVAGQYVETALSHVKAAPSTLQSFLSTRSHLAELARQYLEALLHGKRHIAGRLIMDAVDGGASIKSIYLQVFQRTQREVGRLWQMNQISVAQEHFCTAATQFIMSQLYPYVFSAERIGRRMVATSVDDELHELGVRMVADFFQLEGWDTYYLGANTPTHSILQTLEDLQPDLLALSVTMAFHLPAVAELIADIRATEGTRQIPVLVGGYPFNVSAGLWRQVDADGFAPDAEAAVAVGNDLAGGRPDDGP